MIEKMLEQMVRKVKMKIISLKEQKKMVKKFHEKKVKGKVHELLLNWNWYKKWKEKAY